MITLINNCTADLTTRNRKILLCRVDLETLTPLHNHNLVYNLHGTLQVLNFAIIAKPIHTRQNTVGFELIGQTILYTSNPLFADTVNNQATWYSNVSKVGSTTLSIM